jgi:four helix bundle protein
MLHTDTRIYRRSLELIGIANQVIANLPRGHADLADQLRRASASITLNFSEGCGKSSPKDRRRYFFAARGSANEVVAIFDVARAFGIIDPDIHNEGTETADHLAAMLSLFK